MNRTEERSCSRAQDAPRPSGEPRRALTGPAPDVSASSWRFDAFAYRAKHNRGNEAVRTHTADA